MLGRTLMHWQITVDCTDRVKRGLISICVNDDRIYNNISLNKNKKKSIISFLENNVKWKSYKNFNKSQDERKLWGQSYYSEIYKKNRNYSWRKSLLPSSSLLITKRPKTKIILLAYWWIQSSLSLDNDNNLIYPQFFWHDHHQDR